MARVIIGKFRGNPSRPRGPGKVSGTAYRTVLSHIIDDLGDYPSGIYFVEVEGKDPSPSILAALQEEHGKDSVRPASERPASERGGCCGTRVFAENATEGPGEGRVELEAGYHCGLLCAGRDRFTLLHRDGEWTVESRRVLMRS
jgi:hypothetical protein